MKTASPSSRAKVTLTPEQYDAFDRICGSELATMETTKTLLICLSVRSRSAQVITFLLKHGWTFTERDGSYEVVSLENIPEERWISVADVLDAAVVIETCAL